MLLNSGVNFLWNELIFTLCFVRQFFCIEIHLQIMEQNLYALCLSTSLVFFGTCSVLLTLRRRIKSHLLFAGIIRSSPFSLR